MQSEWEESIHENQEKGRWLESPIITQNFERSPSSITTRNKSPGCQHARIPRRTAARVRGRPSRLDHRASPARQPAVARAPTPLPFCEAPQDAHLQEKAHGLMIGCPHSAGDASTRRQAPCCADPSGVVRDGMKCIMQRKRGSAAGESSTALTRISFPRSFVVSGTLSELHSQHRGGRCPHKNFMSVFWKKCDAFSDQVADAGFARLHMLGCGVQSRVPANRLNETFFAQKVEELP